MLDAISAYLLGAILVNLTWPMVSFDLNASAARDIAVTEYQRLTILLGWGGW